MDQLLILKGYFSSEYAQNKISPKLLTHEWPFHQIETNQFICMVTQLTGSYMRGISIANELIQNGWTNKKHTHKTPMKLKAWKVFLSFAVFKNVAVNEVSLQHGLPLFALAENFHLCGDHSFNTFASFSKKLTLLTS